MTRRRLAAAGTALIALALAATPAPARPGSPVLAARFGAFALAGQAFGPPEDPAAADAAGEDAARIVAAGRGSGEALTAANALQVVRGTAARVFFPGQAAAPRPPRTPSRASSTRSSGRRARSSTSSLSSTAKKSSASRSRRASPSSAAAGGGPSGTS